MKNLTLTRVVFEFIITIAIYNGTAYLTLTRVVFEFTKNIVSHQPQNLTLTRVVFEFFTCIICY